MVPFFSVIIPSFNSSHYISNTLGSLKQQTFKDFEVIVVDDFSNDYLQLSDIVDGFNVSLNIQLFWHTENRNGAAARNTCVDKASGLYLACLDSDDVWLPERLQIISSYISSNSIDGKSII